MMGQAHHAHDHIVSDPEKLAKYVRSLPEFVFYETIDGNYNHIGATVADAVLQANNRYATHVKPRVNRILATYPEVRTTTSVLRLSEELVLQSSSPGAAKTGQNVSLAFLVFSLQKTLRPKQTSETGC